MANCSGCGKFISSSGVAKCTECAAVYHKGCVSIPQTARVSTTWTCAACKAKAPRRCPSADTDTPIKCSELGESGGGTPSPSQNQEVAEQLRLFRTEFSAVRDEMAGLRQEMVELHRFIEGFQARFVGMEERVKRLEERIEERPVAAAAADGELAATVAALKLELCDRDQDLLLNDLELTGIPEHSNESPTHLVCLVAHKLGVGLDERDIVFAERVGPRRRLPAGESMPSAMSPLTQSSVDGTGQAVSGMSARPRPLIVRLARRGPRGELLRAARVRRGADTSGFDLPGNPSRFYVNERLTRLNRSLFYLARQECVRLGWRFHWTKDGRVYVRRHKDSAASRIRSEADIGKVFATGAF
ncbi:hypothetical protein MSG28_013301 [Choristoneura fumiferana]|uniref:Uncharacterized protein n=2 Tax=Choristoneura fumiferana TaxID=7141 RepID=A0ACC0KSY6_CHOFU|nr:hypothetical protein MSG28_013301 [Choristoneura fumiferana]